MAEKKSLSARQVLADIRSGMSDNELMNKYTLSSKGLQSVLAKLVGTGLLKQYELESRSKLSTETPDSEEDRSDRPSINKISHRDRDRLTAKDANEEPGIPETQPGSIKIQNRSKATPWSAKAVIGVLIFIGVSVILALVMLQLKLLTTRTAILIVGLFLELATNVAVWLLISCLVAFIIAKIRKAESVTPYLRKAAWVALVISLVATIPGLQRTFKSLSTEVSGARFEQIIKGVVQDENYLTPQIHQEFWGMINREGISSAQIRDLRDKMTGLLTVYQPLFWKDAVESLKTGQPCKSPERDEYEKNMLRKGLMTNERIRANDLMMAKIAAREAVTRDGQSIVFSEDTIEQMLLNIQQVIKRQEQLFTPPQK